MRLDVLSPDEVLAGYDAVSRLYPLVPPMSTWRAWEYGAYRRYALPEPVLDVGWGDGTFSMTNDVLALAARVVSLRDMD